jgi:hypothetical protein
MAKKVIAIRHELQGRRRTKGRTLAEIEEWAVREAERTKHLSAVEPRDLVSGGDMKKARRALATNKDVSGANRRDDQIDPLRGETTLENARQTAGQFAAIAEREGRSAPLFPIPSGLQVAPSDHSWPRMHVRHASSRR